MRPVTIPSSSSSRAASLSSFSLSSSNGKASLRALQERVCVGRLDVLRGCVGRLCQNYTHMRGGVESGKV